MLRGQADLMRSGISTWEKAYMVLGTCLIIKADLSGLPKVLAGKPNFSQCSHYLLLSFS